MDLYKKLTQIRGLVQKAYTVTWIYTKSLQKCVDLYHFLNQKVTEIRGFTQKAHTVTWISSNKRKNFFVILEK